MENKLNVLAVIDSRSSEQAKANLSEHVKDIFYFNSKNITYNSISCHPDIFIYQDSSNLIVAPNSPSELIKSLESHNIKFEYGKKEVGRSWESSVGYNCLSTEKFFFHKEDMTDPHIFNKNIYKKFINLPQSYTRCSMINISNEAFLTSDAGIKATLDENNFENFFFSPSNIRIVDHKNGFLGGTCGIFDNKIFFNGNIDLHEHGADLRKFLSETEYEIICLDNDFLYDGGGIFFIEIDQ